MSQRKPGGQHTDGRRKSENRQRQKLVGVRFGPVEYEALTEAAEWSGKSAAAVLRETFIVAREHGLLPDLHGIYEDAPDSRNELATKDGTDA